MMHDPRYFIQQQQKGFEYQQDPVANCPQYNGGLYPQQPQTMQQNGSFYAEPPSCMDRGIDEPLYEPKRRFSPPQIDSPPLAHREMSYDGAMVMDPPKYCEPSLPNFNHYHPPPPQDATANEKFRKISVHANFYNYNSPYDERPRDMNRRPTFAQPANVEPTWRKQSSQNTQMLAQPVRKFSQPAEVMVSPPCIYDQPSSYPQEQMLSPQPLKREVSFGDSPMETEPVRKKSSLAMNPPSRKNSGAPRRHANIPTRKASQMASKSQLRAPRFGDTATTYTPPPILSPMRNGTGLFWQACKGLAQINPVYPFGTGIEPVPMAQPMATTYNPTEDVEMNDESPGLKIDEGAGPSEAPAPETVPCIDKGHPARKKGFFYVASTMNQPNFADELEALRKESISSTSSHRSADDAYRKSSFRKLSTMSNVEIEPVVEEDETVAPRASDATPHINIGSLYQAKVYKWKEREICQAERDAIEDKDQLIFSVDVLEGIDDKQIKAYELLACSQAVPNLGRNKELALHLLMENRGNIEAAVSDLLRSDTLDWEQYPIVFGSTYVDSCNWTPEEVNSFQDAIYKTEKDFAQVAQELGNKTVKECIEFYYTWKKACPDDYRKLRNLRRKRQLLEINMQNEQQQMEDGIPLKKCSLEDPPDDDIEILNHSTLPPFQGLQDFMEPRPQAHSFAGLLAMSSPLGSEVATSSAVVHSAFRSTSPKDLAGIQRNYQPSVPRGSVSSGSKKGAQPSADGFFHCRLCDKCFEKVKSLNAHMKSHAMKARAEAEAKAQVDAQIAAQNQLSQNSFQFANGSLNLANLPATLQGLAHGISPNAALSSQGISLTQNLLAQQGLGLPQHARAAIPLLQQHINHTTPIIN